ncbi:hypothetical protein SESBI_43098 [Sesbania bispinosa]|nr:hypothetical protein SESBI_43098 [Sesbania bispinosa]
MQHTTAMNFGPRNPTPIREPEMKNHFKESQKIFDKFFKYLFSVIALKTSAIGEALFKTHPIVMTVMVLMIVLFFFSRLLGTMLQQRNGVFSMILVFLIMVTGSISSVLVLTIISLPIAWLTSLFWVGLFALFGYYSFQELYKLVLCAISDIIKKLSESYGYVCTRLPV